MKSQKIARIAAIVIVVSAVLIASVQFLQGWNFRKSQSSEEWNNQEILRTSNDMNQDLPLEIDSNTVLLKSFAENGVFGLIYQHNDVDKYLIDTAFYQRRTRKDVFAFACFDSSVTVVLNKSVQFHFIHYDRNMNEIAKVKLSKSNCPNLP
jgi:LPS sulfotransferase NodH